MANTTKPPNGIVFFHYRESPYARRVVWYLAFRHIAYAECIQPRIMPRPDLKALGIKYRRTPSMAIGRDVYIDTRIIINRLEELFPASEQHPAFSTKETAGLASLLNKLSIDAGLFTHAVSVKLDNPAVLNEAFQKDRAGFLSKDWTIADAVKARPEALVHLRQCFDIIESLFPDDRKWIGGNEGPSLADLEGVWIIDWLLQGDLPKDVLGKNVFPKVYSWHARFFEALDEAKKQAPEPVGVDGAIAVPAILGADFTDNDLVVEKDDPTGLTSGTTVDLYPTDTGGFALEHQDIGKLVKLTKDEVAIAVRAEQSGGEIHLHAPRWSFKVQAADGSKL